MNLALQFKNFRIARMQSPLSANAIALYFVLLEEANNAYFPEWLCLPNSTLEWMTGFSKKPLGRARNELVEKGYIAYEKGKRGQAPKYKIIPLSTYREQEIEEDCSYNCEPDKGQTEGQNDPHNLNEGQIEGQNDPYNLIGDRIGDRLRVESTHIYKQNKTINSSSSSNNINNNNIQAFSCYEGNIGLMSRSVADSIQGYLDDGVEDGLICAAIEEAANNNVRKWNYVNRILSDKLNNGIKTLSAYRREKEAFEREKKPEKKKTKTDYLYPNFDEIFEKWQE